MAHVRAARRPCYLVLGGEGEWSKATNVVRGYGQGSSLKTDLKAEQGSTGDQREIVSGEADSFLSALAQQRNSGRSGSKGSATVQSTR